MRTVETKVYTFDELSDRAKERARDWYRDGMETDDYAEYVIEDAARMADILGINLRTRTATLMSGGTRQEPQIYWSGFSSQGDGACFVGTYSYRKGSTRAIKREAPQDTDLHEIAETLRDVQKRNFYRLEASVTHTGHYSHEYSTTIEVFDREDNYRDLGADEGVVKDALRDFMRWVYRSLEREYEYQTSDEQVDETIRANDYEFDEQGNRA